MLICIASGVPGLASQYKAQMAEIRRALDAGGDPLELLLIERIALCWARVQYVEEQVSYSLIKRISNAATAAHWDKLLTQAQNRFLKSCLALERVRRLRRRPQSSAAAVEAIFRDAIINRLRGLAIGEP
jgi:hypothetical protein